MPSAARRALQQATFPSGVPRLWCPILTHFKSAREPDAVAIREHLTKLSPVVKGILVPGSTGEGWEMNDDDVQQLLSIVLPAAEALGVKVLLGILKTDTRQMLTALDGLSEICDHPAVVGRCARRAGQSCRKRKLPMGCGKFCRAGSGRRCTSCPK